MKNFTPTFVKRQGLLPPGLYAYFLDSFWFKAAGLDKEKITEF
jgi:hypothetical protein